MTKTPLIALALTLASFTPTSALAQTAECRGFDDCDEVEVPDRSERCNRKLPGLFCKPESQGAEQFGDWIVKLLTDEMDINQEAIIITAVKSGSSEPETFRLIISNGGSLITQMSSMYGADHSWPFCTSDTTRIAVDDNPVTYLATIEKGGSCDSIPARGRAIAAMKRGKQAKVRLAAKGGYTEDWVIGLDGFTAAFNRAIALTGGR